jgi:hypothetical protein
MESTLLGDERVHTTGLVGADNAASSSRKNPGATSLIVFFQTGNPAHGRAVPMGALARLAF